MENITDKVTYEQRLNDIDRAALFGLMTNERIAISDYIAALIEQAYVAGSNHYYAGEQPAKGLDTTGMNIVRAQLYVKFKGLRK